MYWFKSIIKIAVFLLTLDVAIRIFKIRYVAHITHLCEVLS